MARINLLPWREQLREERKQRFLVAMAAFIAVAPSCVADKLFNIPPKLPIGVLTADTITASFIR